MFRVGLDWADVVGYEGLYKVSRCGDVLSVKNSIILRAGTNPSGYRIVALYKDGVPKTTLVHRVVAKALIPNPWRKPYVNHLDCVRINNRVENLEWCTPAENSWHGVEFGRIRGVPKSLSDTQAEEVRTSYRDGANMKQLAAIYQVSTSTIKNVIREKYYPKQEAL